MRGIEDERDRGLEGERRRTFGEKKEHTSFSGS
jgi:hypothetical protein